MVNTIPYKIANFYFYLDEILKQFTATRIANIIALCRNSIWFHFKYILHVSVLEII